MEQATTETPATTGSPATSVMLTADSLNARNM